MTENPAVESTGIRTSRRGVALSNPAETLMQLAAGWLLPRSLHVIADLGIADAIDEGPRSVADVAAETGAHPQALARTLRLLSAYGVFATRDDMVSHTASSRLLRSDHPQSLRSFARMLGLPTRRRVPGRESCSDHRHPHLKGWSHDSRNHRRGKDRASAGQASDEIRR
jgi:hypothetical protein